MQEIDVIANRKWYTANQLAIFHLL